MSAALACIQYNALMANVTYAHIAIVLLVAVLFFGNKLPEIGRLLAKSIRNFRQLMSGIEDEVAAAVSSPDRPATLPGPPPQLTQPGGKSAEHNGFAPEPPLS
jgi:TatA/E family protein of Tat protein translocase